VKSIKAGDLLYTVNLNGEEGVFEPQVLGTAAENFDFTVGDDGKSLTVKGKEGEGEGVRGFYGAVITGLVANAETSYSMIYKVKANGTVGKNNSVGVGGIIVDGTADDTGKFYSNYGNHNTVDAEGSIENRRSALSLGSAKLNGDKYVMFEKLDKYAIDSDGFVTMRMDFAGEKLISYILKDGSEGGFDYDNWIEIEKYEEIEFDDTPDGFGFMLYAYYRVVDTTVKDVEIYKGQDLSYFTTTARTTKAPILRTTVATTTVAPTPAATTEAKSEGGCGGALTFAAAAIVPALAAGVVLARKKKFDE